MEKGKENSSIVSVKIHCLTKEELARTVGISISYINKLISHGKIPYIKIGRSIRFLEADIQLWLQKRRMA